MRGETTEYVLSDPAAAEIQSRQSNKCSQILQSGMTHKAGERKFANNSTTCSGFSNSSATNFYKSCNVGGNVVSVQSGTSIHII
jgi:hypothetical protein